MNISPARVGGGCAVLSGLLFLAWPLFPAIAWAMGFEFPQYPFAVSSFSNLTEWAPIRTDHRAAFLTVHWLVIFGVALEFAAAVGFFWILRRVGPLTWFGLTAWITGLVLVMVEHILVMAIDHAVMPGYVGADEAAKPIWAAINATMLRTLLIAASVGNTLDWGVAVPIFALASLRIRVVPKWIGWLGVLVGVLQWYHNLMRLFPLFALVPLPIALVPSFIVWMVAMGVVFLRMQEPEPRSI